MKLRSSDRQQTVLAQIYVEELIPADHKARAIWDLVGRMDLIEHRAALDELFAQLLALLAQAGLVDLKQVMHDGTKIRAVTGADTFRREKTLRERLQEARQAVAQFGDPRAEAPAKDRQSAARERVARERKQRMEAALEELMALPAEKKEQEKAAVRVSMTESEARIMQHGDGAMAASYNAQITTEASHKIIVGAHLSQCSSDVAVGLPDLQYSTVGAAGMAPSSASVISSSRALAKRGKPRESGLKCPRNEPFGLRKRFHCIAHE